ncbi:hypothetical protein BT69DRAFT_722473 [Atractiella rhizophila]|nr:hypothetical protein BT69DRAFT_722473 [Atractiella rhizophila]
MMLFLLVAIAYALETAHDFERREVELPARGTAQRIKSLTEYCDSNSPFPGVLGRRQSSCTDPGYGKCNSYDYCCPLGGKCCGNNKCCSSGKWCYSTGCCYNNENGCDSKGCCQQGEQCCKGGGCCEAGTHCIKFASGNPGCCHTDQGYYPCASALHDFCCPLGSTCFVDDLGVPKCRSSGSVPTYSQLTNTPAEETTSPNAAETSTQSSTRSLSIPTSSTSSDLATITPTPPSVPRSTIQWVPLDDPSFIVWSGDWTNSGSPCNSSDSSRSAQGTGDFLVSLSLRVAFVLPIWPRNLHKLQSLKTHRILHWFYQ